VAQQQQQQQQQRSIALDRDRDGGGAVEEGVLSWVSEMSDFSEEVMHSDAE